MDTTERDLRETVRSAILDALDAAPDGLADMGTLYKAADAVTEEQGIRFRAVLGVLLDSKAIAVEPTSKGPRYRRTPPPEVETPKPAKKPGKGKPGKAGR